MCLFRLGDSDICE